MPFASKSQQQHVTSPYYLLNTTQPRRVIYPAATITHINLEQEASHGINLNNS